MNQNPTVGLVESQIKEALEELETLLPDLGHSQSKRLLLAAMRYPMEEAQFDQNVDGDTLVKAYSATKRITDSLVALGVETVIEQMVATHKAELENTGEANVKEE